MGDSRRTLVRKSFLAMILSYLRAGVTTTDNFNTYPTVDRLYTFTHNSELWHIGITEGGQVPVPVGVTIEFVNDIAEPNKAMPQRWTSTVRFRVRVPFDFDGSATSTELAEKIDEALYRSGGRTMIRDFSTTPITETGYGVEWQTVPRGEWREEGEETLTDFIMEMQIRYSTPGL